MALTGNKLIHMRSAVASSVPTNVQLGAGQIAINTADGIIFILNSTNTVVPIASVATMTKAASSVQTVNGKTPTAGAVTIGTSDIGTYGVLPLDINGKAPLSYLPSSVIGAINYQGTWNANTNTPTLPDPTVSKGFYWIVTTPGAQFGLTFTQNDWVVSDGIQWDKVDAQDSVTSVNGKVGTVTVTSSDVNALNLTTGGTVAGPTVFNEPVTVPTAALGTDATNLTQVQTLIAAIPASGGTVTSVAVSVPSILNVSGTPITTSGTIAITLANTQANKVFAGPTTGADAVPAFRILVAADIPALDEGTY